MLTFQQFGVFLGLLLLLQYSEGFSGGFSPLVSSKVLAGLSAQKPSTLLYAKKQRRRKADTPPSNELPDFDLKEDEDDDTKKKPSKKSASIPNEPSSDISSAMMGSPTKPVRSVDQLIADRSLEKNFQFDETEEDSSLPDLAVLAKEQNAELTGRKRSKREARVAAALERKATEEEGSNPLAQIPFLTDEKGEVSAIKVRCSSVPCYILFLRDIRVSLCITCFFRFWKQELG